MPLFEVFETAIEYLNIGVPITEFDQAMLEGTVNRVAPHWESGAMLCGQDGLKTVAFITNTYRNSAHADVIGTKLFAGIPMDEGIVTPQVKIVSVWIDQIGANDTGVRIAKMNGAAIYPTIAEALTLGGDKLSVDAVIYIGEHGDYKYSRLGVKNVPTS